MGLKKTSKKTSKKSTVGSKVKSALGSLKGGSKSSGGRRRSKGPTYWANKVLVEKLKKKYHRLKFGGK